MTLDKGKALLIDALLEASIKKHKNTIPNDPNFQLQEFNSNHAFDELQDVMAIAQLYKTRYGLPPDIFSYDGFTGFSMTLEKLRPFLRTGGFAAIWEQEETDRQFKSDVKTVNNSVKETNTATRKNFRTQFYMSIATIFIAGLAAWISWLAYQQAKTSNETEQRLKTLETSSKALEMQIQQYRHLTVADTVHSIIVIDTLK